MNGLIAFFDILGYQSFLENNASSDAAASETALKVLRLITEIPLEVKGTLTTYASSQSNAKAELQQVADAFNHLIFSDTVLLSIAYPPEASEKWKTTALTHLTAAASILFYRMFSEGLPMRGVIIEGDFLVQDTCFAGQAIVNAYHLSDSLDFSGLVYGSDFKERIQHAFGHQSIPKCFISYLSPKNNGLEEEKLTHINWLIAMDESAKKQLLSDIDTFVLRSFWAHNKDCALSVDTKLANTVKLVRRFVIALDSDS